MKTLKSLLMLCAGLSFCACSSDNEPQFPEGTGEVTVKIKAPSTRTLSEATADGTVVNGDIKLVLTHSRGEITKTITYNEGYSVNEDDFVVSASNNVVTATFYGIGTPSKLTASMHDGVNSYAAIAIDNPSAPNMQAVPTAIPVYGETESFTLTEDVIEDTQGADYLKYTAAIQLEIPVARLEVNIVSDDLSDYGSVKVIGAYLDDIYYKAADLTTTNYYLEGDASDYKHATTEDPVTSAYAPLYHKHDEALDITTLGTYAPDEDYYYAFNFYPNGDFPKVKFLLQVSSANGATIPQYQYAIISGYDFTNANSQKFEKGSIYQITGLKLNGNAENNNIQIDEEGASIEYALVATVKQASWKAFEITGSWTQGETVQ